MKGICRKVSRIGVVTHVLAQPLSGKPSYMTVEEYEDQDIKPPLEDLPVCENETGDA